MHKLRVTTEAQVDLQRIARYTEKIWGVAQRNIYLKEIDGRFFWLCENFSLGRNRSDIKDGYYSYQQGRHVIFYMVTNTTIDIISILHENMDFKQHL